MERRRHQVDAVEWEPADDERRRRVEPRQGNAFAGSDGVPRLVAEGVHCLDGLRLPVRNGVARVLVEAEVAAYVNVVVVDVTLIAEERVGLYDRFGGEEGREPVELALLRG